MAFCTSLEGQTVVSLSVYATSAFSTHSLISTVYVVQGVVYGMVNAGHLHLFCSPQLTKYSRHQATNGQDCQRLRTSGGVFD